MISSNFTSNSQIELKLWPPVIATKMTIWTKITDVMDSNLLFKLFKTAETKQRRCLRAAAGCGTRFTFRRKIRCKFARRRKWSGQTKATPTPTGLLSPPKLVELWKRFLLGMPSWDNICVFVGLLVKLFGLLNSLIILLFVRHSDWWIVFLPKNG